MTLKNIFISLFSCIFSTSIILCLPTNQKYRTELVQVLFRHGARTPIDCEVQLLGTNETLYKPWGFAQLTNQGMAQEYKIGQLLRERYTGFLPNLYDQNDVYAYASATGRTKASLELVLAALYPPTKELVWNSKLNWMPIPIYSNPRPLDIHVKPRNCPKYIKSLQDLYNSTDMKAPIAEHDDIRETLKNLFGRVFKFGDIFCVYNAIIVHKNMNLSLPNWYTDEIFLKIKKAVDFYLDTLSYTNTLKRLNGGTLVRRFVENIEKSNIKSMKRKIYLYSTHDKTVHAFASSHNLKLPNYPNYGTAIIHEKLSDEKNNLYVRLLLWSGEPKLLTTLKLPNCTEICPLTEYLKIVNSILPTDEEMLCLYQNLQPNDLQKILNTDSTNIE